MVRGAMGARIEGSTPLVVPSRVARSLSGRNIEEAAMKTYAFRLIVAMYLGAMVGSAVAVAQSRGATGGAAPHVAAAKTAAGKDRGAGVLVSRLCVAPPPVRAPQPQAAGQPPAQPQGPPPRSAWAAEPVKVFDNLY